MNSCTSCHVPHLFTHRPTRHNSYSGSFKIRGATNAVFSLTAEECAKGVVTHSSGNHAGAVALAAKLRGIPAHIVVPSNTPSVKTSAVEAYGGMSNGMYIQASQCLQMMTINNQPSFKATSTSATRPSMPGRPNVLASRRKPVRPLCTLTTTQG